MGDQLVKVACDDVGTVGAGSKEKTMTVESVGAPNPRVDDQCIMLKRNVEEARRSNRGCSKGDPQVISKYKR